MVEFEDGPWAVRVTAADDIRLTTEERWLIGAQLAVGAGAGDAGARWDARRAPGAAPSGNDRRAHRAARTVPSSSAGPVELLARLGRDGGRRLPDGHRPRPLQGVNDTVGHEAGDRVLVAAADGLRQAVRESDLVGRWGGDEFVVLMPGIGDARAVRDRAAIDRQGDRRGARRSAATS